VICPQCGTEYREGFTHCTNCDVDLIPPPPPPPPDERPAIQLVKVFEGGNPAVIPVVESLFDDAGIEYSTTSENIQDLFAWGRFGGSYNYAIGPIMFYVRAEDESDARALIATLGEAAPINTDEPPNR
jgi:hypothetical protein